MDILHKYVQRSINKRFINLKELLKDIIQKKNLEE